MIKLSIEESSNTILPNGSIYASESKMIDIEIMDRNNLNYDTYVLKPKKKMYNDEDNTQFTYNNKTYIARERTSKDTCEENCIAKQFCLFLRCTPSMLDNSKKPIIFTEVFTNDSN